MAVPDQIKELTMTTVQVPATTYHPALAADPDRTMLVIHNIEKADFWLTVNSVTPSDHEDAGSQMVPYYTTDHRVEFTSPDVPIETVYIWCAAHKYFTFETASR